jgi:hypothetical protein
MVREATPAPIETILTDDILNGGAAQLGLEKCYPELCDALREAGTAYLLDSRAVPVPRRSEVVREIAQIEDCARQLSQLLGKVYATGVPNASIKGDIGLRLFLASNQYFEQQKIGLLALDLERLANVAARVRTTTPPDKGGRTPSIPIHVLIVRLAGIFECITRKRAGITYAWHDEQYEGAFFNFVSTIVSPLDRARGEPPRDNFALGKLIRAATARKRSNKKPG